MDKTDLNSQIETIRKKFLYFQDGNGEEKEFKECLDILVKLLEKIAREGVFSPNEEFEEIKTEDLKFLIIPYYQAEIIQKFNDNRRDKISLAFKFYEEFFKILDLYKYFDKEKRKEYINYFSKEEDDEEKKPSFEDMTKERNEKILTYKYKKALSDKLTKIEKEQSYDDNREYWLAYLELCVINMKDGLKSLKMELDSINYIEKIKKTGEYELNRNEPKKPMQVIKVPDGDFSKLNLTPGQEKVINNVNFTMLNPVATNVEDIIALKNNIRENVFKPTNLPTMTLDEFADKEMARMKEQELMQEEAKNNAPNDDSDDERVADEKTRKAREWDDWKDANPKGSGNRMKR